MFNFLSEKITNSLDKLRKITFCSERDVLKSLDSMKQSLIDSDVALEVVDSFIEKTKERALKDKVYKNISPAKLVMKIVREEMLELLGEAKKSKLKGKYVLVVGLQGAGKTTTVAKIAQLHKSEKPDDKVLISSLDIYRPAAREQLSILADQINVDKFDNYTSNVMNDLKSIISMTNDNQYDLSIIDTAGRINIDAEMMKEIVDIHNVLHPEEVFLIVDSTMGHSALKVAQDFYANVPITGVIATKLDGDSKGGAILSMKHVIDAPIKWLGSGESVSALEEYDPERVVTRILGGGDLVGLLEESRKDFSEDKAKILHKKIKKGSLDFNDILMQIESINKMGMGKIMSMLPNMPSGINFNAEEESQKMLKFSSIIKSMNKFERTNPTCINLSRKTRIAKGSGVDINSVNALLKHYKNIKSAGKKFGNMSKMGKNMLNMDMSKGF